MSPIWHTANWSLLHIWVWKRQRLRLRCWVRNLKRFANQQDQTRPDTLLCELAFISWPYHGPGHINIFLVSCTILLVLISLMCLVGRLWVHIGVAVPHGVGGWCVPMRRARSCAPGKAADLSPDSAGRGRLVNRPCMHQGPRTKHCDAHQGRTLWAPNDFYTKCMLHFKVLHIHIWIIFQTTVFEI